MGQFEPEQLNELIVGLSNERPIYLSDVEIVPRKQDGFTLRNDYPSYYIMVQREFDANTVTILGEINKVIVELNEGPLAEASLVIGLLLAIADPCFLMRSSMATFLVTATVSLSVLVAYVALR